MSSDQQHLSTLQDIRHMMQRSSRFLSLSGLSGIAAGLCALGGAFFARTWIRDFANEHPGAVITGKTYAVGGFDNLGGGPDFDRLRMNLFILAGIVFTLALLSALYFTWRRAGQKGLPLWDRTTRQLTFNMVLPLVAGGLFILTFIQNGLWGYVAPACLLFYGLALINGSKYTVRDIRYLGISEVVLGLINTQFMGQGLLFWAIGFGVLHIVYGFLMWYRYERKGATNL